MINITEQLVSRIPIVDDATGLRMIEDAARTCYNSPSRVDIEGTIEFVKSLLARGHDSPLEFLPMAFNITTSRDVMAEFTRHRHLSFCVQSQRYVTSLAFIKPIQLGGHALDMWQASVEMSAQAYNAIINEGGSKQDARKVLPNSTATQMQVSGNARSWRHFLTLRLSKAAYPEMRELAWLIAREINDHCPATYEALFADIADKAF